jgi:hypothetical protein
MNMTRKGDRIVARQIMSILEQNKGYGLRFNEIYKMLIEIDCFHFQGPISNNLKFLLEQGKIVRIQPDARPRYGIPMTREDGTRYIIVKGSGIKDIIVELGK